MKLFACLLFLFSMFQAVAQVGIGTNTPNASSVLDISSVNKGFLPPRMTKENRKTIANPVAGLMIWCTNCGPAGEIEVYNGAEWTNMVGGIRADIQIADNYGGGIVAFIYQPGDSGYVFGYKHGLIITATDQEVVDQTQWGCHGTFLTGTFAGLSRGQANTTRIINSCSTPSPTAAKICDDLVLNGYDDWYLPSKDELNSIYKNFIFFNLISGTYWSSTEFSSAAAWGQDFNFGNQTVTGKTFNLKVRAVRSF